MNLLRCDIVGSQSIPGIAEHRRDRMPITQTQPATLMAEEEPVFGAVRRGRARDSVTAMAAMLTVNGMDESFFAPKHKASYRKLRL